MDTISRENNSMLPIGGIIVGVVGLLIGGFAAVKVSGLQKTVTEQIQPKIDKIDAIEATANAAAPNAQLEKVKADLAQRVRETNDGFGYFQKSIESLTTTVTRLDEEMKKKPAPAPGKAGSGPVVAGPGEYVVQSGDSFSIIARKHGVSLADVAKVNPGVDSSKLKPGQKLKLPSTAKK